MSLYYPPLPLEVGPPLPLEVGHLFKIQLGDLGERCKLHSGSGAEPQPKSNLVHFSLCNLVATILVIFYWGNLSKVVCFSHMRNFSHFKGGRGMSA